MILLIIYLSKSDYKIYSAKIYEKLISFDSKSKKPEILRQQWYSIKNK